MKIGKVFQYELNLPAFRLSELIESQVLTAQMLLLELKLVSSKKGNLKRITCEGDVW